MSVQIIDRVWGVKKLVPRSKSPRIPHEGNDMLESFGKKLSLLPMQISR